MTIETIDDDNEKKEDKDEGKKEEEESDEGEDNVYKDKVEKKSLKNLSTMLSKKKKRTTQMIFCFLFSPIQSFQKRKILVFLF